VGACGTTCGIQKERDRERRAALVAAERAHPALVWRADPVAGCGGLPFDAIGDLGARLEDLLPVRALPREGDGGCDWLYLLAGVHSPSLCELMGGTAPASAEARHLNETYVRIAFSPFGRFVTLQEVLFSATFMPGGLAILEEPIVGINDRRLQLVVKGLQGALRKTKLVVLDMAFVAQPPPTNAVQGAYEEAFGQPPMLWSFLFEAAPPSTTRAALIAHDSRTSFHGHRASHRPLPG
jgi:hypothetical protein